VFERLIYEKNKNADMLRLVCCAAANPFPNPSRKSLISLDFPSCILDRQFVGSLDFQGFQRIQTEFSTKLSTDLMDQAQSTEKSRTYILFQEVG
jgi:hypothetical protein